MTDPQANEERIKQIIDKNDYQQKDKAEYKKFIAIRDSSKRIGKVYKN